MNAAGPAALRRSVHRRVAAATALAWLGAAPFCAATERTPADLPPADGRAPRVETTRPAALSSFDLALPASTDDLDAAAARGYVRMLVTYDRTHFWFDGGRQAGIVADAIAQFERWLNARLKRPRTARVHAVVVPVPRSDLAAALLDGRGDVIAMPFAETPDRLAHVAFAPGGRRVNEVLVVRRDSPAADSPAAIAGREVHVRRDSSYYESLLALNERLADEGLAPVRIRLLDPNLEAHEALELVNDGVLPATVAEAYVAKVWAPVLPDLRVEDAVPLREGSPLAWAVRPGNPQLLEAVTQFQQAHGRGTLWGNLKAREYFATGEPVRNPLGSTARLAEVRSLFQRYADAHSLDWLLVAAQAFQESALDHSRRSRVGAVGIMQMMPATARDPRIGIQDVHRLDRNIEAGTKYLRFVLDRYYADAPMTPLDKALFALASYNAGPARVARLRAEAARDGFDPNVWFGHVEVVAARRIGAETVDYVRNIYKYYLAYRTLYEQHGGVQSRRMDPIARTRYPSATNAAATPIEFAITRGYPSAVASTNGYGYVPSHLPRSSA
jgi:membrane-bound lytic murein transglycosylase MltF